MSEVEKVEGPTSEDYRCLKVDPEAGAKEVDRAYQRMKALYGENSLAIYSLVDDEDRKTILERIESAYRRISRALIFKGACSARDEAPLPQAEAGIDPAESPGLYLKSLREQAGFTIREIATRTKVGSLHLTNIEEEKFHQLPAPVYLRGFLLEFARALGIPRPEEIASLYLERIRQQP